VSERTVRHRIGLITVLDQNQWAGYEFYRAPWSVESVSLSGCFVRLGPPRSDGLRRRRSHSIGESKNCYGVNALDRFLASGSSHDMPSVQIPMSRLGPCFEPLGRCQPWQMTFHSFGSSRDLFEWHDHVTSFSVESGLPMFETNGVPRQLLNALGLT